MPELELVSFNCHYGLGPTWRGTEPYDLVGVLERHAADVMVVQEVWRPDGHTGEVDEFAARHGYAVHDHLDSPARMEAGVLRFDPQGPGSIGLAILTRVPARAVGRVLDDPPSRTGSQGCGARRSALRVTVGTEHPLEVIGLHLTSGLPFGPPRQLHDLATRLPPPGQPTVIAGDCNFWGPGVVTLLRGWQRAVRGRTWPARHPHSQIDHVLVRPGEVRVRGAEVLPAVGSDHRPVRAVLEY